MKDAMARVFLLAVAVPLLAQPAVVPSSLQGFPFTDETLNYVVKSPVGLSFGKVQMSAARQGAGGWAFKFSLDASLPIITITDRFDAFTDPNLCSIRFERSSEHGSRKSSEVTYIDRGRSSAVRATRNGGGLSEIPVGLCPYDGLSFLYHLRRELGQGRIPPNDSILVGGAYRVSLVYVGEKMFTRDQQDVKTDQINCVIRGPKSEVHLEIQFARDAARTPLVVRYPFTLGTFWLELVR
jgi:hypothetical protein